VDLFAGELVDAGDWLPDLADSEFHHDGYALPDGRLLTLEAVTVRGDGPAFEGFRVRRIDPRLGHRRLRLPLAARRGRGPPRPRVR
jgi:hypothetical protein